jgi:mono/diheme cytochrome c family protein
MTLVSRPRLAALGLTVLGSTMTPHAQAVDRQVQSAKTGAELYLSACVACHGPDGRGAPPSTVGLKKPPPDFSDCQFTTSEPDRDWRFTIRLGGRARALDDMMPAFGDALSDDDIDQLIHYLRGFCRAATWPHGDLNLPRPLVTGEAFPENEAIVTTAVPTHYVNSVKTRFAYERRMGARSQYEVVVPFNVQQLSSSWNRGLGDVAVAVKHVVFASASRGSMVSASGEMTFPTGKEIEGLGNRLTVFEPRGTFSQVLPHDTFVHGQVGFEFPLNLKGTNNAVYWRAAMGKTLILGRWGRAWSPMVELLGNRELTPDPDEVAFWDLLPELQVTLSRRQHISVSGGMRIPLNYRTRTSTVIVSFLWDWYQGGLFSGW